jgi:hypothetical protein
MEIGGDYSGMGLRTALVAAGGFRYNSPDSTNT